MKIFINFETFFLHFFEIFSSQCYNFAFPWPTLYGPAAVHFHLQLHQSLLFRRIDARGFFVVETSPGPVEIHFEHNLYDDTKRRISDHPITSHGFILSKRNKAAPWRLDLKLFDAYGIESKFADLRRRKSVQNYETPAFESISSS